MSQWGLDQLDTGKCYYDAYTKSQDNSLEERMAHIVGKEDRDIIEAIQKI